MPSTVDKIRRALEKKFGISEDEMRPLALKYSEEVQRVNDRLDQAVDLLRKGLRSEAIQSVNMTPNAMQAAAELEFPETDEWHEILQFMGIPIPPTLNEDAVSQINDAIVEGLPLDALMRRHRQLAIAKAPLGMRLRVLRQIGRRDTANPVWNEDIEIWEKERLREVDMELDKAIEKEDIRTVCAIHQELTKNKWLVPPAPRLVEQATFVAEGHYQMESEKELSQISDKMLAAYEVADEPSVRQLAKQWQTRRKEMRRAVSPELETKVAPIFAWLTEMKQKAEAAGKHSAAVANLKSVMASGASLDEIHAAHQHATQFGEPIPDEVAVRYRKLIAADKNKKKLKIGLIVGGVSVVVLATFLGLKSFLSSGKQKEALNDNVAQLSTLIGAQNWQQAKSFYDRLERNQPDIASDPKIQALYITVEGELSAEKDRAEKFKYFVDQARSEDPSKIDENLLKRARSIAKTDTELAEVDRLLKMKQRFNESTTSEKTQAALDDLAKLRVELSTYRDRPSTEANLKAVTDFYGRLLDLPKEHPGNLPEFNRKFQELKQETSATKTNIEQQLGQSTDFERDVNRLVKATSLERFSDVLNTLSGESTEIAESKELKKVVAEESSWRAVEQINSWLADIATAADDGVTAAEARRILGNEQSLQSSIEDNPIGSRLAGVRNQLTEASQRDSLFDAIMDRVKASVFNGLVELRSVDPTQGNTEYRYFVSKKFLDENPSRLSAQGSIGIPVVDSTLGAVRTRSFQGKRSVVSEPDASMKLLLIQMKERRIHFMRDWEREFVSLIAKVTNRENLDGLVKERIIADLIDDACSGSQEFKDETRQSRRELDLRESVRDNWFKRRAPDSKLAANVKEIVPKELMGIYGGSEERWKPLITIAEKRLQWFGFLIRESGGQLRCVVRGSMPEITGDLYVAVPAGGQRTELVKVGGLAESNINLTPSRTNLVPGRPVFLLPE